jgi:dephospho-CoA kinase
MPALAGRGYADLDIREGGTASLEYARVTFGDVPDAERQRVRRRLEAYCGRDTEGMLWLVEALANLVNRR